jgi:hypothetical protein
MAVTGALAGSFELGPIRPPSEAYSLLIRVTRNCPWNRCRFCPVYKGAKFQLRSVAEVKQDIDTARAIQERIKGLAGQSGVGVREAATLVLNSPSGDAVRNVALWMYAGGRHAFLQDANTLQMKTGALVEVIKYLKETFPGISRITSYARSKTAAQKSLAELVALREAGLSRLHIGLESGYDPLLRMMEKGVTAAEHIAGGRNVVSAGISLSEYIMPGLGGRKMWREHATATARVLNEIAPDYIRARTLVVNGRMLLHDDVVSGVFQRQTDEEIVTEIRLLLENLSCHSHFVSDHINNLLPEVEGKLPWDKERMLAIIDRFQSLPPEERLNFMVGRRLGYYNRLDDLNDASRHEEVGRVLDRLAQDGSTDLDELVFRLMEGFV